MISYFNNKARQGRDNYETPEWCWELFFKYYTNREKMVWSPFYCKGLCANHLEKYHGPNFIHCNEDFFKWNPEFDCIVDNPPYSCKKEVFERCIALGKPFALYVPLDTLERRYIRELMNDVGLQIIIPAKRTDFITDYDIKHTNPPHKTIWLCWKMNLLDGRQLIFE
jgi:hypothetical protein